MKNPKKYSRKSKKSEKGQISIEFLILIAAFLSSMLLLVPIANKTYNIGIFGIESAKAKNFAEQFKQKIDEMNFLGNSSRIEITANPSTKWNITINPDGIRIKIKNDYLEEEKTIETKFENEMEFRKIEKTIEKNEIFAVGKNNGIIYIESAEESDA